MLSCIAFMFIELIGLQLLFACSTPLNKLLLEHSSVLTLMSLRMLVSGIIILLGHQWGAKQSLFAVPAEHRLLFIQKIIFGSYLKYLLKYWGLQYLTPLHMAFLCYTTPLWAAFFDYYCFNHPITVRQLIGIGIATVGVIPLLMPLSTSEPSFAQFLSFPSLAVIGAVAVHCYGVTCTKKLTTLHHYSPFFVSGWSNLITGILALGTALCIGQPLYVIDLYTFTPLFMALICLSNIIGKSWHTALLKTYSMTTLAVAEYLIPLYIALYSWFIWGMTVTSVQWIAGICIVMGMYIMHTKKNVVPFVTRS